MTNTDLVVLSQLQRNATAIAGIATETGLTVEAVVVSLDSMRARGIVFRAPTGTWMPQRHASLIVRSA